jgi:hypothetical protein
MALVAFEVQLRRRNVEGAVALFCEDGVLFGSEEYENAIGTDELGVFFSRLLLLKALLQSDWTGNDPDARVTRLAAPWPELITCGSRPSTIVIRAVVPGSALA